MRLWAASSAREAVILLLLLFEERGALYDAIHRKESCRIYGNIDLYAYYYVDLIVGSPPQRVSVIADTGSGVTAFPCKSCRHCGRHIDPNFDMSATTTGKWVSCGHGCSGRCASGHCSYSQGYTEGSSIAGWWFKDYVRLGDAFQHNPPVMAQMGCHQDENKLFYTQKANGILGLRPPRSSDSAWNFLQALFADKPHVDSRIFSMCLAEWGGLLVVGGFNETYHTGELTWAPLESSSGYYRVKLSSMRISGKEVASGFRSTMIDSGTTYTYMGATPYNKLRGAIESACRSTSCGRARLVGKCWEIPEGASGLRHFPRVELMLADNVKTYWTAHGYLYRRGESNRWCYAFENDGPNANTVLGASWMINKEVVFDMVNQRVGIAEAQCPEFKKRPNHDPKILEERTPRPTPAPAPAKVPASIPSSTLVPIRAPACRRRRNCNESSPMDARQPTVHHGPVPTASPTRVSAPEQATAKNPPPNPAPVVAMAGIRAQAKNFPDAPAVGSPAVSPPHPTAAPAPPLGTATASSLSRPASPTPPAVVPAMPATAFPPAPASKVTAESGQIISEARGQQAMQNASTTRAPAQGSSGAGTDDHKSGAGSLSILVGAVLALVLVMVGIACCLRRSSQAAHSATHTYDPDADETVGPTQLGSGTTYDPDEEDPLVATVKSLE